MTDERIAVVEQKLDDYIESNDGQHREIITKLDSAMRFQNRLQWVGGTILLMIGSLAGWIIHNAAIIWQWLPMHGHTH